MNILFKILAFLAVFPIILFAEVYETASPNSNVVISFELDSKSAPCYSVSYKGTMLVDWSTLGLVFLRSGILCNGLEITGTETRMIDETYPVIAGKTKYSRNYCNETKIELVEKSAPGRKLELYFRAYNDGAAFRYEIPVQRRLNKFVISSEETQFNFSGNYTCWALKRDRFRQSYEGEYIEYELTSLFNDHSDTLGDFKYAALPVTFEVNKNLYFCLSEANITNYAGMYLTSSPRKFALKSILSPDPADNEISVRGKSPAVTPWRVFIIGESPGALIESNLIQNLNDPNKISDAASWVTPGKSLWGWWAEDRGFEPEFGCDILSTNTIKYYIDFCAQNQIEYNTIDAGWYGSIDQVREAEMRDITKSVPKLDMPYIVGYANSKSVGIFVWVAWYDLERQLIEALDYYQKTGVKGIKVDFMERDDQYMVDFYHRVAEECAKRSILVNFHGAYKPDGLERTYPNIITREAVLGNEYARWITGLPNPEHNVTIPFTRMITGGMDYTPGCMVNSTQEGFVGRWKHPMTKGTRTQQLAMFVVYESGLITLCESPKIYEKLPEFEFIKQVPASWDSTIVLSGRIGDYIVIARKKNADWYVGAMTDWNERDIMIDFSFLSEGNWTADVYQDASDANTDPSRVDINKIRIASGDSKSFHLAKGGGLALVLRPFR